MRKCFIVLILLASLPVFLVAQSGVHMSLFTGRMSYSIPIYTISDQDFHIDIALRYSSEGFKPFLPAGSCGQDWTMIAGGHITRSVQGLPDDLNYYGRITKWWYQHDTDNKIGIRGFIIGKEKGYARALALMNESDSIPQKEKVFNMDSTVYSDSCGINFRQGMWIDYMPDIFCFNFCGYNGRFMINNSGKVVILSGDFVDVDISGLETNRGTEYDEFSWNVSGSSPKGFLQSGESSQIIIKTTDGYTYVFGGSIDALEYSIETQKNQISEEAFSIINAWHITKITAPNGRSLDFYYKSPRFRTKKTPEDIHSFITDYDWTEEDGDSIHISYRLQNECILQSIENSDSIKLKVSFYTSQEDHKRYNHPDYVWCTKHQKLDSIVITGGENVLRRVDLSYIYITNEQKSQYAPYWRYLKEVAISGVGKYTMDYESTPWNINMYPTTNAEYKAMVDRYGFWRESSLTGMLSQVSLPTGGFLKFTYENHDYGIERCFTQWYDQCNVKLSQITNKDAIIGGVRVKSIETYSKAEKLEEQKNFSYQMDDKSTGVFYNIYEVYRDSTKFPIAHPNNYNMIPSHIGYSYVEQETVIGDEKTKTTFSFDIGRHMYESINNNLIRRNYDTPYFEVEKEVCSGSLTYDGILISPGKITYIESYVGNRNVKSVRYVYNSILLQSSPFYQPIDFGNTYTLGCVDTIVCLSTYSAHITRKLFVCPDVLEKVIIHEYDVNGKLMVTTQDVLYDKKLRPKEIRTIDSRGRELFTKHTYPDDVVGAGQMYGTPSPLFIMIHTNRIGTPVETISGYIENGTEYITGGALNLYAQNTYSVPLDINLPYTIQGLYFCPYLFKTLSLTSLEPINISDFHHFSMSNGEMSYDKHYKLTCQYNYDLMYRLTSITPFGKMTTRYTWNGMNPVTKTIGNQIWKYDYIPYVGIKSITDPRGNTTYYTYDADGRLVEEYKMVNGNKQIMNAYQYHIKTEE